MSSDRPTPLVPQLTVLSGGNTGKPLPKYTPPGYGSNKDGETFVLPVATEIIADITRFGGNLEQFLEAACLDKQLHHQLLYELLEAFTEDEKDRFLEIVQRGQEVIKLRIQGLALQALEVNLTSDKPSTQALQMLLRDNTARGANVKNNVAMNKHLDELE